MAPIPYTKPYATPAQRVAHLRARGLLVSRPRKAEAQIELVGYERLRIYFRSRRDPHLPGRPFRAGTTYQHILRLYDADSRLRGLCFEAVGQFEMLLRNVMSETLSHIYGSHPYDNPAVFRDAAAKRSATKLILDVVARARDERIKHYCSTYSDPMLPPIWTLKEVLTFGASARLLQCLAGPIRTSIAAEFGVGKDTVFANWVACLVDLRNICAHHDRLFNRVFQKQPALLLSAGLPSAAPNRLKALLQCLDHMLDRRGSPFDVTVKVGAIVTRFAEIQPPEAGY